MFKLEKKQSSHDTTMVFRDIKMFRYEAAKKKGKKELTESDFLWKRRSREEGSWDHYLT